MIRIAKIEEIDQILKITKSCAEHLISQHIYQWSDAYPTKEIFIGDINRNELFVFIHGGIIKGFVVLTPVMDSEYKKVKWLTQNKNNLYVHRLAVHPAHQKQGTARKLMEFAEHFAREKKYNSIRLDTFSRNKRNQKFYELRGYQKLGEVYFLNQSKDPFYCYELILNP